MKKLWTVLALALVLGLVAGTAVRAGHLWYCSGSTAYHYPWLEIWYQNNASDSGRAYRSIYESEMREWDNKTCLSLVPTSNPDLTLNAAYYGGTGWLGLASLDSVSSCHVYRASAYLNRSYLESGYSDTNIAHVACQEIAHTFGLQHNRSSNTTCMNDTILTAPYGNQHDVDVIRSIYYHQGCR